MQSSSVQNGANRVFDSICLWVLPTGYFLLLTALFFLPDRSLNHKLYYALFSIPSLLALCVRPRELKVILREPLVLLFLLFATVAIISLAWSSTEDSASSLIKRPLHIALLFIGMCLLLRHRLEALGPVLLGAALLALLASLPDFIRFVIYTYAGVNMRLLGSGALDNPLLSSHLFGFYSVFWLFICMTTASRRVLALSTIPFVLMFAMVLATGSRTPLVAVSLAAIWLACLTWNRRSILLLSAVPVAAAILVIAAPGMLFGRGDSFRFELWRMTLELFSQRPFLGHGYDAHLSLDPGVGFLLSEPHNFALGVLYYVGILGFLPWAGMLVYGLYSGWRHRGHPLFVLASSLLVFGIGAGLTEGGGILSRPKEHWFLIWIPLALIAALNVAWQSRRLPRQPVQSLKRAQAEQMSANAAIIEEDGLGPKVLRLADGTFLKLFRARRWFTSGAFNPYSQRFARNSQQLRSMGIPTPHVLNLYRYVDGSTGVHYQPLPGRTLRQVLSGNDSNESRVLVQRFGRFMASLHEQGVYFRSLHLGNVLLLENGEFGLIDLADMRILPSPLLLRLRQRNLRHMQRYAEDRSWLFEQYFPELIKGYAELAAKPAVARIEQQALLLAKG